MSVSGSYNPVTADRRNCRAFQDENLWNTLESKISMWESALEFTFSFYVPDIKTKKNLNAKVKCFISAMKVIKPNYYNSVIKKRELNTFSSTKNRRFDLSQTRCRKFWHFINSLRKDFRLDDLILVNWLTVVTTEFYLFEWSNFFELGYDWYFVLSLLKFLWEKNDHDRKLSFKDLWYYFFTKNRWTKHKISIVSKVYKMDEFLQNMCMCHSPMLTTINLSIDFYIKSSILPKA